MKNLKTFEGFFSSLFGGDEEPLQAQAQPKRPESEKDLSYEEIADRLLDSFDDRPLFLYAQEARQRKGVPGIGERKAIQRAKKLRKIRKAHNRAFFRRLLRFVLRFSLS